MVSERGMDHADIKVDFRRVCVLGEYLEGVVIVLGIVVGKGFHPAFDFLDSLLAPSPLGCEEGNVPA